MKTILSIIAIILIIFIGWAIFEYKVGTVAIPEEEPVVASDGVASRLRVPEGFSIDVFADVTGARAMIFDARDRMIVSQTGAGSISVLEDADGDGKAELQKVLAKGLDDPHGLALDCSKACALYVAEHGKLSRYPYDEEAASLGTPEKLLDVSKAATDRHSTRTLLFLDSNTLLISVGSSCDVCDDKGMRGKIIAYDIESGETRDYATGLRNAVFMDLHPETGKVYVTEMGRDGLGDDIPPDEINLIKEGAWYGWPWFYGKNVFDEKFRPGVMPGFALEATESLIDLPAHSAPLGIAFIPNEGWPSEYRGNIVVAYHGSWNRTVPTGYKIVRIPETVRGVYGEPMDFVTGFLTPEGRKLGRPVGVVAREDGSMYISDDDRGVIYRLTYEAE